MHHQFSGSLGVNDPFLGALCPSKSGLMNKHTVKHFHGLLLLDSLGSRRGMIGADVDFGHGAVLVASPERSAVVQCILPVGRVG